MNDEVFTASNGYRVVRMGDKNPAGWVKILNRNPDPAVSERHSLGLYTLDALREFFRHEEAELRRQVNQLPRWEESE